MFKNRETKRLNYQTRRLPEIEGKKTLGPGELETAVLPVCWSCSIPKANCEMEPAIGQYICEQCRPAFRRYTA